MFLKSRKAHFIFVRRFLVFRVVLLIEIQVDLYFVFEVWFDAHCVSELLLGACFFFYKRYPQVNVLRSCGVFICVLFSCQVGCALCY